MKSNFFLDPLKLFRQIAGLLKPSTQSPSTKLWLRYCMVSVCLLDAGKIIAKKYIVKSWNFFVCELLAQTVRSCFRVLLFNCVLVVATYRLCPLVSALICRISEEKTGLNRPVGRAVTPSSLEREV